MKALLALSLAALPLALPSVSRAGQISLVTRAPVPSRADTASGASSARQLSVDGRYLLFLSNAPNLVPGQIDTNGGRDVFLFDRVAGTITLVTHKAGASATAGNAPVSNLVRMTPDGRYVAYVSGAGDLAPGASQGGLFLYDRVSGKTVLVTREIGSASQSLSGNLREPFQLTTGGSIVFANGAPRSDVFAWDRVSGKTTLISHAAGSGTAANGSSRFPAVSADGRYVAFSSDASNLLPGPRLTGRNVFLHDRATGKTTLISHASASSSTPGNGPSQDAAVSSGGTWVLYYSQATNLVPGQQDQPSTVDLFLYERATGKTTLVSHASSAAATAGNLRSSDSLMTPDGGWIAFESLAGDLVPGLPTTGWYNVFLFERATGRITLASRAADSPLAGAAYDCHLSGLSADGRRVSFSTGAGNLLPAGADANQAADAFVFDRVTGAVTLVSAASPGVSGNLESSGPVLSADGNWVAYSTQATNLVAGKRDGNGLSDVVLYSLPSASARLVTLHPPGLGSVTPLGASRAVDVSADGRYSVFTSLASNLVPGQQDTNGVPDVFLYDRGLRQITRVSREAGSADFGLGISADGRFVVYQSTSTGTVPGQVDTNAADEGGSDVFLFDRTTGATTLVSHAAGSPVTTGNHASGFARISADGTWILFSSAATDLVAGQNPSPSVYNAYLYDRNTGQVVLLSHKFGDPSQPANGGSFPAGLSADGQVILLLSLATDLIPDLTPNQDTNGESDAFVVDRTAGITSLVSRTATDPTSAVGVFDAVLSADGGTVAFLSDSNEVVPGQTGLDDTNLFLHDLGSGEIRLVSHAAGSPADTRGASRPFSLSADGRWVAFASTGGLVAGQINTTGTYNVFLYDRDAGTSRLVSHASGSAVTTGNGFETHWPSISADGRIVTFRSRSTNLIAGQTGPAPSTGPLSLFVYDRATGANTLVTRSVLDPHRAGNGDTDSSLVSASGNLVLFSSAASDLVAGDFIVDPSGRSYPDVFLYTLP
jgi:Tol biopolymer transport system component